MRAGTQCTRTARHSPPASSTRHFSRHFSSPSSPEVSSQPALAAVFTQLAGARRSSPELTWGSAPGSGGVHGSGGVCRGRFSPWGVCSRSRSVGRRGARILERWVIERQEVGSFISSPSTVRSKVPDPEQAVPASSLGMVIWSRICGKCNLGQSTAVVEPFSYRKFMNGVFLFSEISVSFHSLTVLKGQILFRGHHGHQDSILPEVI